MIYLSGVVSPRLAELGPHVGAMLGYGHLPIPGRPFAVDNCRYAQADRWTESGWLGLVRRYARFVDQCLFVVAPDVFDIELGRGDARRTWDLSLRYFDVVRELGFKVALVAQDGFEDMSVDWDRFDALFVGASTEWKLGPHAADAVAEAKSRGMWCHMGRVNSMRRLTIAYKMGCDSVDGTFLRYQSVAGNVTRMMRWLTTTNGQLLLGL